MVDVAVELFCLTARTENTIFCQLNTILTKLDHFSDVVAKFSCNNNISEVNNTITFYFKQAARTGI